MLRPFQKQFVSGALRPGVDLAALSFPGATASHGLRPPANAGHDAG